MIISFGWTSWALVAYRKRTTWRDWTAEHAAKFQAGHVADAWNKNPRAGGRRIGQIFIIGIERANTRDMTPNDYVDEGFAFLDMYPQLIPAKSPIDDFTTCAHYLHWWRGQGEDLYKVRFEVDSIEPWAAAELESQIERCLPPDRRVVCDARQHWLF